MGDDFGALSPMASFVASLADLADEAAAETVRLDALELDMPIELEVRVGADGSVVLGSGPPTQQIETSFMPVFHQLRARVAIR